MRNTIFFVLIIIPLVSFSKGKIEAKQDFKDTREVQQTFGDNSNIKNLGVKIANINIDNKKNIKITPTLDIEINIKKIINTLMIPKIAGFSELRYNKVNNHFTMINHSKKIKKIYTLNISNNNFNYINTTNNKTIINNNQKTKTNYISNKTTIIDNRIDNSLTNYGVIIIDQSEKNNFNFSPKLNLKF